jgi:DNA-binding LytR/AlgR family response regulator
MQAMNCLILEDEPLAIEVIKDYISDTPGLELKSVCVNVPEALHALRNHAIDILFVDINLPKVNGLDFIKTLKGNYNVILTTAHHEYALEGYDLDVVDYLLKPIEFSRFLQAVNKVFERVSSSQNIDKTTSPGRKYQFFKVDKKHVKVFLDEILYIESLKDYIKIHLKESHIVTKFQIGELSSILDKNIFIRIHKSFIININKVSAVGGSEIEIGKISLPIGRTYKDEIEPVISSSIKHNNL